MFFKVQGLNFSYGDTPILKEINFSAESGQILTFVGPNGSGKTTLSYCLTGIIPHLINGKLTGDVFIDGKNIFEKQFDSIVKKIGYVFQDPENQFITLRVRDELELVASTKDYDKLSIVDIFQLKEILDKAPSELSMGQKQRVALASVLSASPEVLVLDEPGSTIDPCGVKKLSQILKLLKSGRVIILFTHDLELAKNVSDRIIGISDGQIKFDKPVSQINYNDYSNLYHLDKLSMQNVKLAYQVKHQNNNIRSEQVSFQFPRTKIFAIKNFQLDITDNWGFAGLNGSGKTTALLLLAGLVNPTHGEIFLDKKPLKNISARDRISEIGIIFQNPNHQIFASTIYEELAFGLQNLNLTKNEIKRRIEEIADIFELGDLKRDPHTLSFGWRKILALASVFAMQPHFVFFDEPELGLDIYFKQKFEILINSAYENGTRLILASHDIRLLEKFSKHISFMEHGVLSYTLSTNEAIEKIKKQYDNC